LESRNLSVKKPSSKNIFDNNELIATPKKENSFYPLAPILLFMINIPFSFSQYLKGGDTMKKIAIELIIIAATVMAYVLPVFAWGGGG
jgi:hypothetical protein